MNEGRTTPSTPHRELNLGSGALPALAMLLVASGATADVLVYPGLGACSSTLQACIDSANSGDQVRIATSTPIDESVDIGRSLTLGASPGFTPVLGGSEMTQRIIMNGLGSEADDEVVVIEGLTFDNARIDAFATSGAGHSITIRDNVFFFEIAHNNTAAVDLDFRVPGEAWLYGNQITSTGQGIRIAVILDAGERGAVHVERNVITTSLPEQSNAGIDFDLRGSGVYRIEAFSNVIHGVGGCSCGGNAGIALDIVTGPTVTASLTNNTLDRIESANGFNVLIRDPDAILVLDLYNNTVSNSEAAGYRINNYGEGFVGLNAGANNSFMNANSDSGDGLPLGELTSIEPMFVDSSSADYRLLETSDLIDAGIDDPPGGTSSLDAAGGIRAVDSAVDVGAYEYVPEPGSVAGSLSAIAVVAALRSARKRSLGGR